MRTGLGQDIRVDLGQAIRRLAPASELRWETLNGYRADLADRLVGSYLGFYPTRDGRHVVPANIYPGLKSKMPAVLYCADSPEALGRAIARHTSDELEEVGSGTASCLRRSAASRSSWPSRCSSTSLHGR
ncbi:hypothetical protein AB0F91_06435 [Amycolatopsis sp. NPDC023774]|uniref:hypothetical protein n=1 Tax=Amycolatopsis sp. NPDC023774 TaxID=3155015 RepID=UPI0033E05BBB